ncbi:MAG: PEP-CTERM sorting domain-containing protein [Desulfobulbaceae bacterium]|nr:PEP-CTERM sorting domain-containing protein [Desulfobulbaceae bacterium]
MKKPNLILLAIGLVFFMNSTALAVPITYSFSGQMSGTLNGDSISALTPFEVFMSSDTSNVAETYADIWISGGLNATITIGSLVMTATDPLYAYANNKNDSFYGHIIGFGRTDLSETVFVQDRDVMSIGMLLSPYDLQSSTGPITRFSFLNTGWSNIETSYGELNITALDNLTFEAVIAPVPEPATMLLMGTGLAGLVGARRKKKA